MKKWAWAGLGVFLAAMAVVIVAQLDAVTVWIGIGCAYGAFRSFRAAGRAAPARVDREKPRPWER